MKKKLLKLSAQKQAEILNSFNKSSVEELIQYLKDYSLTWSDLCSRFQIEE